MMLKVNRKRTKENLMRLFAQYKQSLLVTERECELVTYPRTTASFSGGGGYSQYRSSTEQCAINRMDGSPQRRFAENFLRMIDKALRKLTTMEREIIIRRYLDGTDSRDYIIYNELAISERQYYRIKSDAFYKLALILECIEYEGGDVA